MSDILVIDYANDENDLELQWTNWNLQTLPNRRRSDSICLSRYGMTNLERYEYFKSTFNKQPIDKVELTDKDVIQDIEDDIVSESSSDNKQRILGIIDEYLKKYNIKSGISKSGEWGLDEFLSDGRSLFICTAPKDIQRKFVSDVNEELKELGARLYLDNYNSIFLKVKSKLNESLIYPQYNPSITEEEAVRQGGFYDETGTWNSILKLESDPNRLYRGRVECLIIKGDQVYLCKHANGDYRIPGGGFEISNDNITQCYNECKEEARILVKNIRDTGITYTKTYARPAEWTKGLPVRWTGLYIEVYVADFDKYYNGYVDPKDKDDDIYNNGRFYNIDDVYDILRDEHKKAIDLFVRYAPIKEDTETTEVGSKTPVNVNPDNNIPNPLSSVTEDMYKTAKEWSEKSGYIIITQRYDLDELEKQFNDFLHMTYYQRKISNQESIRIFGFDNITHYNYLKNRLLKKDKTNVDIDVVVDDETDSNSTISEFTFVPVNNVNKDLKKAMDIINEELMYFDSDKISVHNMLLELNTLTKTFHEKTLVKKFNKDIMDYLDTIRYAVLYPYFTPKEMDELGVFNDNIEDNFYKAPSNPEAKEWYNIYSSTLNPGNDWFRKVREEAARFIKEPSKENKQRLLEYGWNPEIPFDIEIAKKVSEITKNKLKDKMIEIVDVTESLNNLDDYREIPYIPKNINRYNLDSYLARSIEMEHTNGRIFVDYNDQYVAHITIYNDIIQGIGCWNKTPALLQELIAWAIMERGVTKCYCRKSDIKLKMALNNMGFVPVEDAGRIITYEYKPKDINLESALSTKERNKLKDSDFGLPKKRKYPLHDEEHVRLAIKFFNYVDEKDEKELAENIIKKIKEYNMEVNVGPNNRFSKYYSPKNESAVIVGTEPKLYPVFIVTTYTATLFGKAIQKFTKDLYTHAALGFDPELTKLYSFNVVNSKGKRGGLSEESLTQYINDNYDAELKVSVVYLKEKDYNLLKNRLDMYLSNAEYTSYNFKDIFNIVINRFEDGAEIYSMICSQFVDSMFKAINIDITNKPSNLVTPGDLSKVKNPKVYKLYEGKAREYNPKKIKRNIAKLIGIIKPIKESKFIKETIIGNYYAQPIFEVKEFPIGFDEDGSLLIRNYKSLNFEIEYMKSHKLLKSYKAANNWEGIKYELCKLWFMNTILLKKIEVAKNNEEKEELIKIRSKIMTDFTVYLNYINKNIEGFNFSEYYEQTPFSDTVIRISGSTLKYTKELFKKLILK